METCDFDDAISLHPGDTESLSQQDVPHSGNIQDSRETTYFSDISTVDFDYLSESDAEEMLNTLSEAYDATFRDPESSNCSTSQAPNASEPGFSPNDGSGTAKASNTSWEPQPGTNGATNNGAATDGATTDGATADGATTDGATTDGGTSTPTVLVQGVNLSLVKTTTTFADGRVEEQRVASVGYTNSVDPKDIDPQALFNYIHGEFVEYMNGHYHRK